MSALTYIVDFERETDTGPKLDMVGPFTSLDEAKEEAKTQSREHESAYVVAQEDGKSCGHINFWLGAEVPGSEEGKMHVTDEVAA
jgi:hypothetical protein